MPIDAEPNSNPFAALSALSQSFSSAGKSVDIAIAARSDGGWRMKIVDEFGNDTSWEDSFSSAQAALDEALDALNQEGIAMFIGMEGGFANP